MKKFKIATLGCRTNQYESQAYQDQLDKLGYRQAEGKESADLCIVNTCTVTAQADSKSLYQIRKLKRDHPEAKIVVTGCLAERAKKELLQHEEIDEVISNKDKENLLQLVLDEENVPEFSIKNFDSHTRAFVKIQDGCNSYCSYCVIPFVRGRSRSKKTSLILKEIKDLVESGFREIVLTGINIGDFDGGEETCSLADLVRKVDEIEGIDRIRISSIDPDEVDEDLLQAVVQGKKTCPSMHLVLQSGSNMTLKRMNRKYTRQDFFDAVFRLKKANPDFTFTTDIIVGFPGETEEEFQETLDVMKTISFAKVHMFPYSKRPKTRASRMTETIPKELIEKRKRILMNQAQQESYSLRQKFIGREMKVLVENQDPQRKGHMMGHTENFLTVSFPGMGARSNEIVTVNLTDNSEDVLLGKIVELDKKPVRNLEKGSKSLIQSEYDYDLESQAPLEETQVLSPILGKS